MALGTLGILAGGALLGSYGVKILSSQDAKKVYTHVTAAVLRMKDKVVADAAVLAENCGDIAADAKVINEERAAAWEAKKIADAKAVLEAAAEEKTPEEAPAEEKAAEVKADTKKRTSKK